MLAFHSSGLRLSAAKGVRAGASILVRTEILKARIEFGLEQGVSMPGTGCVNEAQSRRRIACFLLS